MKCLCIKEGLSRYHPYTFGRYNFKLGKSYEYFGFKRSGDKVVIINSGVQFQLTNNVFYEYFMDNVEYRNKRIDSILE